MWLNKENEEKKKFLYVSNNRWLLDMSDIFIVEEYFN